MNDGTGWIPKAAPLVTPELKPLKVAMLVEDRKRKTAPFEPVPFTLEFDEVVRGGCGACGGEAVEGGGHV